MSNPAAQAWVEASRDLGIRYIHPYTFITKNGQSMTTTGGLLPNFGSPNGTLLLTRFDPEEVGDAVDEERYFLSALNPHHYEPYQREVFIEALNDWGWYGVEAPPPWFAGRSYRQPPTV